MKSCPIDEYLIGFDNYDEFRRTFEALAADNGEALTANTIIEMDSLLIYGNILEWVDYFGVGNIYLKKPFENGEADIFCFDLKNAGHAGCIYFNRASEVCFRDGYMLARFG